MTNSYFCLLYCQSSSQYTAESTDPHEQELVNICYLIIDAQRLNVLNVYNYMVRQPIRNNNFNISDCINELTNISKCLKDIIYSFDKSLYDSGFTKEDQLIFITDGIAPLRQLLLPECSRQNIHLPFYYYQYYNILSEFAQYSRFDRVKDVNDILNYMMIASDNEPIYSLRQCKNMHKIVLQMYKNGYRFNRLEYISKFEDQFCCINSKIEENTVVRVRGLPWHCTDREIYNFFTGLNITGGGIAFCLSLQGRRNGEALIRFENEEQRDLALARHKHHIGMRYIEVYRASANDFVEIASGSNNEAKEFLNRNGKIIIRMRGLPFDASAKDVVEFFANTNVELGYNSVNIVDGESGVLFVHYPDGRVTGDAFVMLRDEEEVSNALLKHKATMGPRYIELFRSSTAEVQQVFKRSQDPKHNHSHFQVKEAPSILPLPLLPPEMITGGNRKDCIRLKNLPLESRVEQILEFLGVHSQHIIQQGVHMIFNAQGQPSGEAFIQFDSESASFNVTNHKNGKCMYFNGKKHFVEAIQCSGEEMNMVLMGLLPSNLINFDHLPEYELAPPINLRPSPFGMYPHQFGPAPYLPATPHQSNVYQQYNTPIIYFMNPHQVTPIYLQATSGPIYNQNIVNTSVLVIKNAPCNVTVHDVISFLHGYGEIASELININTATAEVFVSFFNRNEAERAIIEKNHHKLGDSTVELFLIV